MEDYRDTLSQEANEYQRIVEEARNILNQVSDNDELTEAEVDTLSKLKYQEYNKMLSAYQKDMVTIHKALEKAKKAQMRNMKRTKLQQMQEEKAKNDQLLLRGRIAENILGRMDDITEKKYETMLLDLLKSAQLGQIILNEVGDINDKEAFKGYIRQYAYKIRELQNQER